MVDAVNPALPSAVIPIKEVMSVNARPTKTIVKVTTPFAKPNIKLAAKSFAAAIVELANPLLN